MVDTTLITQRFPGCSELGATESFPTTAPVSLYGASKLASEQLVLEYSQVFEFPAWINRCGVPGAIGNKADKESFLTGFIPSEERQLKYIGFGGTGYQVRDALHPNDLVPLLIRQICEPNWEAPKS